MSHARGAGWRDVAAADYFRKAIDIVRGVEHRKGDADAVPFRGDAHLVSREVLEPVLSGKIEHIDVRSMCACAWADNANPLSIHMVDQLVAEIQDMLRDLVHADTRDEVER